MKAHQVIVNNQPISLPFDKLEHAVKLAVQLQEPEFTIKEVEVKEGETFRSDNTILLKSGGCYGIVKGVYYRDNPLSIK